MNHFNDSRACCQRLKFNELFCYSIENVMPMKLAFKILNFFWYTNRIITNKVVVPFSFISKPPQFKQIHKPSEPALHFCVHCPNIHTNWKLKENCHFISSMLSFQDLKLKKEWKWKVLGCVRWFFYHHRLRIKIMTTNPLAFLVSFW